MFYTELEQFLISRGKKSITEKIFQKVLVERAKKLKNIQNFFNLLFKCKYNLISFINLKTKGRIAKPRYKINLLEKKIAEHKALSLFGKHIRSIVSNNLYLNLEKEIEILGKLKSRHILRETRNKIFMLSLAIGARYWKKKKVYKKKTIFIKKRFSVKKIRYLRFISELKRLKKLKQ